MSVNFRAVAASCSLLLLQQQLIDAVGAQQVQSRMAFEFSRAYDTCDDADDRALEGTTRVVYSWNDNIPESPTSPVQHPPSQRGSSSVNLVGSNPVFEVPEDDVEQFDLRVARHTILENQSFGTTLYWCEIFEIPNDKPYHIVQFDMGINPDNFVNVHHAVLYDCPSAEGFQGQAGVCPSSGGSFNDDNVDNCEGGNVVWAWAVGGGNNTLPPDIGYPVGQDGVTYVMLEMHYDLPNRESITDDSGIILHVTPTLRDIEAGVLAAGAFPSPEVIIIPPRQTAYLQDGWCPGGCLADGISNTAEQKITLFSGFLHSHLAGREIVARHVRNGTELEPILVDENYDFNYQQYQWFFNNPRELLVGDDLLVQCTYNTEDRTNDTLGGIATHEEMCLAYFMYYPRLPGSLCWSGDLGDGRLIAQCPDQTSENQIFTLPNITEPFVEDESCPVPSPSIQDAIDNAEASALNLSDVGAWRRSFDHSLTLRDGDYELYWSTNADEETIRIGVDVATEGWLGFGFSPNGGMVGSDVIMAWVGDDDEVHFSDRFADGQFVPRIDSSQDYFDIQGARYTVEVDGSLEPSTEDVDGDSALSLSISYLAAFVTFVSALSLF